MQARAPGDQREATWRRATATNPPARYDGAAVRTWWQNLQAIGFTTGVMPMGSNRVVDLNSKGNGTMTVLAGTHSALDPLDGHGNPDVPV